MSIDRRSLLVGSCALAASAALSYRLRSSHVNPMGRSRPSRVAVLQQESYTDALEETLMRGLALFSLDLTERSVLLKPNLVDYLRGDATNTHPLLIRAAAEAFRRLGAKEIVVAEGPGHQRDTEMVVSESGLGKQLKELGVGFVDLNRDELARVDLTTNYTGLGHLWLPKTVLRADFVVSLPKVKAHHWAGVSLSMKNMFGIVPGSRYGWPKNLLHWRGIHRSVIDICSTVPIAFVVADGITAMEGNGPLQGDARPLGKIVLADDPVAADVTCATLMGLRGLVVPHIREASRFLGNADDRRITQLAEAIDLPRVPFRVVPEFEHLRLNPQN